MDMTHAFDLAIPSYVHTAQKCSEKQVLNGRSDMAEYSFNLLIMRHTGAEGYWQWKSIAQMHDDGHRLSFYLLM